MNTHVEAVKRNLTGSITVAVRNIPTCDHHRTAVQHKGNFPLMVKTRLMTVEWRKSG